MRPADLCTQDSGRLQYQSLRRTDMEKEHAYLLNQIQNCLLIDSNREVTFVSGPAPLMTFSELTCTEL
jgi:hypothetical protein